MASNPNLSRKTLVVSAIETTSGTSHISTAAVHYSATAGNPSSMAFLSFDEINPLTLDFNVVDSAPVRASLTPQKSLIGRKLYNLRPKTLWMLSKGVDTVLLSDQTADFGIDATIGSTHSQISMTGAGADKEEVADGSGVAPFFGPLLRACGLKQVNDFSASVIYTPRSSGFETGEVWVWADALLHKSNKVVGTFTLAGTSGEGIELQFDLQGTYNAPQTDIVLPTGITSPTDLKRLMADGAAKIGTESGGVGFEGKTGGTGSASDRPIIRNFNFDAGNTITERGDISSAEGLYGLYVTDRSPTLELTVEVENALTSTASAAGFNPILDYANAKTHNVTFYHGTTAHKKTKFTFPQAQIVDVAYADDNGIRTYNISYNLTHTSDDSEYKIETGNPA